MSYRSKSVGDSKHFKNIPKMEQDAIFEYFAQKGLAVGESEIIHVQSDYELQDNECWIDKSKTKIERVLLPGLINDHKVRDHANLLYFLDLERFQQAWPWPWKKKIGRLI